MIYFAVWLVALFAMPIPVVILTILAAAGVLVVWILMVVEPNRARDKYRKKHPWPPKRRG